MGLGKTLTMISLIATDLPGYQSNAVSLEHPLDGSSNQTTLVIVPPPCMFQLSPQANQVSILMQA
jgi:hypothetical protein